MQIPYFTLLLYNDKRSFYLLQYIYYIFYMYISKSTDGRNPAPPEMYKTLQIMGKNYHPQLVQDFFHQPYDNIPKSQVEALHKERLNSGAGQHCSEITRCSSVELMKLNTIRNQRFGIWGVTFVIATTHLALVSVDAISRFPKVPVSRTQPKKKDSAPLNETQEIQSIISNWNNRNNKIYTAYFFPKKNFQQGGNLCFWSNSSSLFNRPCRNL